MDENNSNTENEDTLNIDKNDEENVENNLKTDDNKEVKVESNSKEIEKVKNVKIENVKKRGGQDTRVVVQYRKPSVFSSIILILIGALIATVVFLVLYLVKSKEEVEIYDQSDTSIVEEEPQQTTETDKTVLDLSVNSEFVKSLYEKIPIQIRGYEPYYGYIITQNAINDNNKLLFVLRYLDERKRYKKIDDINSVIGKLHCNTENLQEQLVIRFDLNEVKETYKSIYGSMNDMPLIDAETGLGFVYEYNLQDNCYYGHSYSGGGGQDFRPFQMIDKCEQNEDATEIYIYDDFIAFDGDLRQTIGDDKYALFESATTYNIPTQYRVEKIIGQIQSDIDQERQEVLYNGMELEELVKSYRDKAGKFKHTYKLDTDGNYYWYSSEKIN